MLAGGYGLSLALAALSVSVTPASTQSTGNDSMEGCGMHAQDIAAGTAAYNSTGTTTLRLDDEGDDNDAEWHLTYTLRDERAERLRFGPWVTMQTLSIFLSVPEDLVGSERGNDTDFCVYLMAGVNETSEADPGDGNNSCNGVLSDECIGALRGAPPPTDDSCPRVFVDDECGFSPWVWQSTPNNFTDSRCGVDGVPGVDLPSGYTTFDTMAGAGLVPPDASRDSYETYDLRVQQPVPVLITERQRSGAGWRSEVICLAPSNVSEGSREPEADLPPSGAGGQLPAMGFVVAAVAAVQVFLV